MGTNEQRDHFECLDCGEKFPCPDLPYSGSEPCCPYCDSCEIMEIVPEREFDDEADAKRMDEIRAESAPVWKQMEADEAARVANKRYWDQQYASLEFLAVARDIVKVDTDTVPLLRMLERQAS